MCLIPRLLLVCRQGMWASPEPDWLGIEDHIMATRSSVDRAAEAVGKNLPCIRDHRSSPAAGGEGQLPRSSHPGRSQRAPGRTCPQWSPNPSQRAKWRPSTPSPSSPTTRRWTTNSSLKMRRWSSIPAVSSAILVAMFAPHEKTISS